MSLEPCLISGFQTPQQSVLTLTPIPLDKPPYNEDWLQNLIHQNPQLVPAGEVEAAFENIIPVVRELPLPSGYLDNLYITPEGYPVLVEVKLWKNQEARRKVIAQILEYAKDFATLSYDTLNTEIRKLSKTEPWGDNPLYETIARDNPTALPEATFVDRVTRNMREGRFLLLILGDGVREDMASLATHLMHHSLRYVFGMVQIRLFTMPDGSILAQPDIFAKTQTIERHVTVVATTDTSLRVTETTPQKVIVSSPEKTSLSLDDFFEKAHAASPENAKWLKEFVHSLSDTPIDIQVGKNADSLMLKAPFGNQPTLMHISPQTVSFWTIGQPSYTKTAESKQTVAEFLNVMAAIVGGEVKTFPAGGMDVRVNGQAIPTRALMRNNGQQIKETLNLAINKMVILGNRG